MHGINVIGTSVQGKRFWRAWPRPATALAVAAGLALLTAACGGSQGAASSPPASADSGGNASTAYVTRLAFARCVRAHGVPAYPDPDSNGQEPPGTKQLLISNPRFPAAVDACRHLLPNDGQQTEAPQPDALTDAGALRLAGCMRTHGYPQFPDPTIDAVGQPVFNVQAVGIAPHSPQVLTTLRRCLSLLHLTGIPQASS